MKNYMLAVAGILLMILSFTSSSGAQQPKSISPVPAPVPPQIATAQKVFISNGGDDTLESVTDDLIFNGGPDRAYNEFYAAMQKWGRYRINSSPDEADLVLKIEFRLGNMENKVPGFAPHFESITILGRLSLVIVDPKTHSILWVVPEYVRGASLLRNRDKNFDQAIGKVMDRMRALVNPAPLAARH